MDVYGWPGAGLMDAILAIVQGFVRHRRCAEVGGLAAEDLTHPERNADFFWARLST